MKTQDRLKAELKVLEAINKIIAKKTFGTCQVSFNKGFTVFKFENSLTLKLESLTALEVVRDLISTNENCTEVPTLTFNSLTEEGLYPNSFKVVKLKSLISLMGISRVRGKFNFNTDEVERCGMDNIVFTTNPLTQKSALLGLDPHHLYLQDVDSAITDPTTNPYGEGEILFRIPFWLKPILNSLPKTFQTDIDFKVNWGSKVGEYEFKYGFLTFRFSLEHSSCRFPRIEWVLFPYKTELHSEEVKVPLGCIYTEGIVASLRQFKSQIGKSAYNKSEGYKVYLTCTEENFEIAYQEWGNEVIHRDFISYNKIRVEGLVGETFIVDLDLLINQLTTAESLSDSNLYGSPFIYFWAKKDEEHKRYKELIFTDCPDIRSKFFSCMYLFKN